MPLGQAAGGAKPQRKKLPPGQAKALITASDFTFLGGFRAPGAPFTHGLTHRYVNGQRRLLNASYFAGGYYLSEYEEPALSQTEANAVSPSNVTDFGGFAIFDQERADGGATDNADLYHEIWGLYWDEPSQKLLFAGSGDYTSFQRPIGVATLNENNTMGQNVWISINSALGFKAVKGFCKIPDAAQQVMGSNRRLAVGFGGYQSTISNAGHLGPACVAIDPTNLFSASPYTDVNVSPRQCMGHAYNPIPNTSPYRGLRNPECYHPPFNYDGLINTWQWSEPGSLGFGNPGQFKWCGLDGIKQAGLWIETESKKGFLIWMQNAYDGDTANILSYTEISATGSGPGDNVVYDITVDSPMDRAYVHPEARIMVPNTAGNYSPGVVNTISGDKTQFRLTVLGAQQQNGDNRLQLDDTRPVGHFPIYFSGADQASFSACFLYVYDPDNLYANQQPAIPQGVYQWRSVDNLSHNALYRDDRPRVQAVTFDETTNHLFVMDKAGYVKKYLFNPS